MSSGITASIVHCVTGLACALEVARMRFDLLGLHAAVAGSGIGSMPEKRGAVAANTGPQVKMF
uniref:Predicted protein n=1 Tax=Hordeum vulgare subsp. vulgare TaxID=112509 RepID=F2ECX1_HORVV|nr:predicted protein [Hordeum vulgare subsp. vulgare]